MENTNRIKSRNEIAKEDTWALEDLYSTEAAWEQELATLDEDKKILSSYAGHLSDSAEKLFSFLQYSENTSVKTKKLGNYCMRKADEDTRDAKYQAMTGRFISAGGST